MYLSYAKTLNFKSIHMFLETNQPNNPFSNRPMIVKDLTERHIFSILGPAYVVNLAIDYSTGNLYYTAVAQETSGNYIGSWHRKASLRKTLLSILQTPEGILLYPSKG